MKYLKNFNENINRSEIDAICEIYNIKNYTINDDGSIDVDGNVDLFNKGLKVLPLKFRKVSGDFYCSYNQLISLEGAPQSIGGDFHCRYNKLTSLEGAPQRVGGIFWCYSNNLKNIDYLPKYYKELFIQNDPISKIIKLFITSNEYGLISNREDKDLIMDFIDREIIQQDKLLVNRLVEFLDDIGNPKTREELIELLKNDYEIR
ncbi:MAG: hypothetical protein M0R46_17855 [Candidatus Muirbacterium halophilum]|nr:hypothetical protein [Candidatus Muirbacterium halophilum]